MEHPLGAWLRKRKVPPYIFARDNGMSYGAVYKHIRGAVGDPKASFLQKIETATGGSVTVKKQMDFLQNGKMPGEVCEYCGNEPCDCPVFPVEEDPDYQLDDDTDDVVEEPDL